MLNTEDIICTECKADDEKSYMICRFCKVMDKALKFLQGGDPDLDDYDDPNIHVCNGCCQVCRHMISVRLNIPELEELKKRDVRLMNFDTCHACEKYVIHHYQNKEKGITLSNGCYEELHQSVYKLVISTCENKLETITLSLYC
jgi:hypothetical protein